MSDSQRIGALIGLLAGGGLIVMLTSLPSWRRERLVDRVAPWAGRALPGQTRQARTTFWSMWQPTWLAASNVIRRIATILFSSITGDDSTLNRRLIAAGLGSSGSTRHRITQLIWAGAGAAVGLTLWGLAMALGKSPRLMVAVLLVALMAMSSVLLQDWLLSRRIKVRRDRMSAELPATAELLALAIAAGESPALALARVGRVSSGLLADQFTAAAEAARGGESVIAVLRAMAVTVGLPSLSRMVDAMSVATDRGTPLGDVLRAQAADLRSESSRAIIEAAGRKEIAMLMPVVFLVMPTVVVVALFPGWQTLSGLTG